MPSRADQTDQQVADQSKAATLHHPAGQPAGNDPDNDDYEKTLIGQVHDVCSTGLSVANAGPSFWFPGVAALIALQSVCSEVGTGSREQNASDRPFRFDRN
jgi:hypothetical protein